MMIREQLELRETEILSPYASFSRESRGREREEEECDIRPVFQRDRDRILHSKAFRRLRQKTQVNEVCELGFKHNEQSVRVVEVLEKQGKGLNLTWEVRDGIRNHKSSGCPATLEGKLVQLSDKIAYINHDIDDAVRGGILKEEDLPSEYTDILGHSSKARLNRMVHDVITQSMDRPEIHMSDEVWKAMRGLRQYLFEHVYLNPVAKGEEAKVMHMITNLYHIYMEKPELMPEQFLNMLENGAASREQIACDYIAGMTDSYAVHTFEEYFIPKCWKN